MSFVRVASLVLFGAVFTAPAFNFTYNSAGYPQHWNFNPADASVSTNVLNRTTRALRYYIAADAYSATNTARELNAVRNACGQWQAVPNSIVKFEDAGLVAPGYDVNTSDNTNVIYWAKSSTLVGGGLTDISGSLGATFATFSLPSNSLQQFDIVINGVQKQWFTDYNDPSNPGYFIEGTVVHELGHALGLRHSGAGGVTMLYVGTTGVDTIAGLSADEVAFARTLYPSNNILSTLGHLRGTVTKNNVGVLGAVVVAESTNGTLAGSTVTLTNGSYSLNALPPGGYNVRVVPLDPATNSTWLIQPPDIDTPAFDAADTTFLPTANTAVTLTAGATNTLNLSVTSGTPAFRIGYLRAPTTDAGYYTATPYPVTMSPGQSNYTIGVFSETLPTNGAAFSISGDGLTLGAPTYQPGNVFVGLNGISVAISVASNATPGLRSFVIQKGADRAYANGYLEILPKVPDYNFDGLDDTFQRKYFFPFTQTNAAPNADPDQDKFTNAQENIAGTVPTNSASFLKLSGVVRSGSGTTVSWVSATNHRYQLLARTNGSAGAWFNVGGVVTATNASAATLDTTATNGLRVYKVQALP